MSLSIGGETCGSCGRCEVSDYPKKKKQLSLCPKRLSKRFSIGSLASAEEKMAISQSLFFFSVLSFLSVCIATFRLLNAKTRALMPFSPKKIQRLSHQHSLIMTVMRLAAGTKKFLLFLLVPGQQAAVIPLKKNNANVLGG